MTSKTKSDRFRRLLSHGYFAPELPPCFVSADLAKFRESIYKKIINLPKYKDKPAFQSFISEPSWFYFPRFKKDDRRHGVPNPISQLLLSKIISENYINLRTISKKSGISSSPPIFDWNGPRALMRPSIDLRDDFRIDLSSRREEFCAADIRAFFHSIYTHAIPWAIYGKEWAKKNRKLEHYGNMIDFLCRNAQGGQTIGLPVGPDTSRLIAEVIASAIDVKLRSLTGITKIDASRYVDDYTISSEQNLPGEALIAALRQAAGYFELELNNEKSATYSTSIRQSSGWKQEILSYIPRKDFDDTAFQHFFYRIGQVADTHPDLNIEKYAIQNSRSAFMQATKWKKIQNKLISAYRRNPSLIPILVEIIILRQAEHRDIDKIMLKEFIIHRLPVLTQANRTGEIIWLLFLAIRLQLKLPSTCLSRLYEIENSMISLLIAVAKKQDIISGTVNFQNWNRSLSGDGLRSPMWLYAYESIGLSVNPAPSSSFIEQDPYFSLLHDKKVRFLNIDNGFTSIRETLRSLRGDNSRTNRLREDFEDFDIDLDEFDDIEDNEFEDIGY